MKLLYVIAFVSLLTSCDSRPDFSATEKSQAHFFVEALALDNQATEISNSGAAYTIKNQEDMAPLLALQSAALSKAEQIPTNVLLKMHQDLPANFDKYKKGLALRIDNLKNRNVNSEIQGHKLIDEWADWFNANRADIKVPKL